MKNRTAILRRLKSAAKKRLNFRAKEDDLSRANFRAEETKK